MSDSIYIVYPDSKTQKANSGKFPKLKKSEIANSPPKDLYKKFVSVYIGTLAGKAIFYEKVIVIKEDVASNLEQRVHELLKYEESKRVLFAVFSAKIQPLDVSQIFESKAKAFMKKKTEALGRIWTVQINSDGQGCGLVAADDKIRIWRQV